MYIVVILGSVMLTKINLNTRELFHVALSNMVVCSFYILSPFKQRIFYLEIRMNAQNKFLKENLSYMFFVRLTFDRWAFRQSFH